MRLRRLCATFHLLTGVPETTALSIYGTATGHTKATHRERKEKSWCDRWGTSVSERGENSSGLRDEERRSLLDRSAVALGEAWAQRSREILSAEGRRPIGGWPGTMSEARARARVHLGSETVRQQLGRVVDQEIEQAARATYARAREVWLAGAEREDEG